jgi:TatD DNase family protein
MSDLRLRRSDIHLCMYKRIDIHAHMNFAAFDADREVVIDRALKNNTAMINVGSQYDTSKAAVAISDKYENGVYVIVGLHPIHTSVSFHDKSELGGGEIAKGFLSREEVFDVEKYRELISHPKVVGIGECGLDYYHISDEFVEKQKEVLLAQITLANETKKPLMLHIRQAYSDALDILSVNSKTGGNAHFFSGTLEEARRFLDLGFTLSFTGVITFTKDYDELVRFTPLDMIQAETDCPFVTPVPYRGKRNEPAFVSEVINRIALIKEMPVNKVEKILIENAQRVWKVPF